MGHDHHSHDAEAVPFGIVTVSSSRSLAEDPAGDAIEAAIEDAGHESATRSLVTDDPAAIVDAVSEALDAGADVVVTTGGTGLTPDDVTVEAVSALFDRDIPGFGELFRRLSQEEIGTRTIGSRATAGIASATPVFCLPGSENAVRLGVDEIVLAEVGHLVGLAGRGVDEPGEEVKAEDAGEGDDEADDSGPDEEAAGENGSPDEGADGSSSADGNSE